MPGEATANRGRRGGRGVALGTLTLPAERALLGPSASVALAPWSLYRASGSRGRLFPKGPSWLLHPARERTRPGLTPGLTGARPPWPETERPRRPAPPPVAPRPRRSRPPSSPRRSPYARRIQSRLRPGQDRGRNRAWGVPVEARGGAWLWYFASAKRPASEAPPALVADGKMDPRLRSFPEGGSGRGAGPTTAGLPADRGLSPLRGPSPLLLHCPRHRSLRGTGLGRRGRSPREDVTKLGVRGEKRVRFRVVEGRLGSPGPIPTHRCALRRGWEEERGHSGTGEGFTHKI